MHITAKIDYAVRTLLEIARTTTCPAEPTATSENDTGASATAVKAETIATAARIAPKVLESVLGDLRRANLVVSRRGPDGGYWLTRPAAEISVADVIRAVEGPLASVRGERPEDVVYPGSAQPLQRVWIALRVNIRAVLENVSIAEIVAGDLPEFLDALTDDPGAWARR